MILLLTLWPTSKSPDPSPDDPLQPRKFDETFIAALLILIAVGGMLVWMIARHR